MLRLVATLLLLLAATPSGAGEALTFAPAKFEFDARLGQQSRARFSIANTFPTSRRLTVEIVEQVIDLATERVVARPPSGSAGSLAEWIQPMARSIVVDAGKTVFLDAVVSVPTSALPGTYYAAIKLMPVDGAPELEGKAGKLRSGFVVRTGVTLPIVVDVLDGAGQKQAPALSVVDVSVARAEASRPIAIRAQVLNQAGYRAELAGTVVVLDASGAVVVKVAIEKAYVRPGQRKWLEVPLTAPLEPGSYTAMLGLEVVRGDVLQEAVSFDVQAELPPALPPPRSVAAEVAPVAAPKKKRGK